MTVSRIVFLLFTSLLFLGCVTLDPPTNTLNPVSKIFYTDYQTAWQSTALALEDYPIASEDSEKGTIVTEKIPTETIWNFPVAQKRKLEAAHYKLYIYFTKGKMKQGKAVQVSILKKIQVQKGFIEGIKRRPSNGLEEKAILYRILREIKVKQAIKNYQKSKSS